jgi:hypothetical protein
MEEDTMKLIISPKSHLDHGLVSGHITLIAMALEGRENGFCILQLDIPTSLPPLECGLRGPTVGTPPVLDKYTRMSTRGDRKWASRVFDVTVSLDIGSTGRIYGRGTEYPGLLDKLEVRKMVAIVGPDGTLFTAYGGPLAPREPGDTSMNAQEREESIAFWNEHALVE